jgi:23S rRNA pseudouridine2605 synthase
MPEPPAKRFGVARVLSKQGLASRTLAATWVREGRVRVNGRLVRDPEFGVLFGRDVVTVAGKEGTAAPPVHLMLNKPRGLVTSTSDEQGRDTVYRCFAGAGLPWMAPVGRLDKASEGLLLFSNDTAWSARITDPDSHLDKTYAVHIDRIAGSADLEAMQQGVAIDGERHAVKRATLLRSGGKRSWLEIVLDEGRNRQIRRILAAMDIAVLRLIRVRIGALELGDLAKGAWRHLEAGEVNGLRAGGSRGDRRPST